MHSRKNSLDNIFEKSQTIRTEDKRSYTHLLKRTKEISPEELQHYYKSGIVELGNLQIIWINTFGERNVFHSKTISTQNSAITEKFSIRLINPPAKLYVEEPQSISLRITNASPYAFRLKLYIKEEESKTISINALSHQVLLRGLYVKI